MYYLVYISYTVGHIEEKDLEKILDQSKTNNQKLGLTGLLLFIEDKFIQVLEGEKQVVKDLYEVIQKDKRHRNVSTLIEGNIDKRNYPDWSMAFKSMTGDQIKQNTGFEDILEYFKKNIFTDDSHISSIFMKMFFDKNFKGIID
jgi:hypothetical protein